MREMLFKGKIILGMVLCVMLSCANDEDAGAQNPESDNSQVNVYPHPPSIWLGDTEPYYSAGYVGDVMPFYDNGKFNLFFLHDAKTKPAGEGFHDIHLFETENLTSFDYKGRMIPYGVSSEPDFAIGTGAVVKSDDVYYFYYTGHNGNLTPRESVLCATSKDLKNWTKIPDFKLTAPAGYYDYDFRDPHVFFNQEDGKFWMLVSTQTQPSRKAVVLLFTSDDLTKNNWEVQPPIYTTSDYENYLMLECADLFKMGAYWYLIFSENWSNYTGTHYRIATSPHGPWVTPKIDRFDGEYLYAAKTASDGDKRYLFGWTARKTPENNTGNKDWAGNLVAHELVQNVDGTLGIRKPESISELFSNEEYLGVSKITGEVLQENNDFILKESSTSSEVIFDNLKKSNEIQLDFKLNSIGKSGIILNYEQENNNAFKLVFDPILSIVSAYMVRSGTEHFVNKVPVDLNIGETYHISITTNKDVCVMYINDKIAFSNRLYEVNGKEWGVFSENAEVEFKNISVNNPY